MIWKEAGEEAPTSNLKVLVLQTHEAKAALGKIDSSWLITESTLDEI